MHNILLVLNLFVLEALLSVDNAAVLAVLVEKLPKDDSKKALRYGIIGAYVLRGLCLFMAGLLVSFWFLKVIGGLYLCYLTYGYYKGGDEGESRILRWMSKLGLNGLWGTIVLVEIMDLVFSMDNIFASVALSQTMWVIYLGVFLGILAMRFVAMRFVDLMRLHPSLEASAYIVILLLGIKLVVSGLASQVPLLAFMGRFMSSQWFDLGFSLTMMCIFLFPLLKKKQVILHDLADSVEEE